MSAVALTTRELPDGRTEIVIDCAHFTTTALATGRRSDKLFNLAVQILVRSHEAEERCGCALRIRAEQQATS